MSTTTKQIVSKSKKRRAVPKGSGSLRWTQEVIYTTKLSNGKLESRTVHEIVDKD